MDGSIIFDAHCDTISELLNQNKHLTENELHIDMRRLLKYTSYTQVFAAFIAPEYRENAMERAEAIIDRFYDEATQNNITVCKSYTDWVAAKTTVKAFLSLEGGEPINTISDIEYLYRRGVRIIAPTWNYKNKLACGVMDKFDTGLSAFGEKAVAEMNRLGIIIDVSHLSPKSFWDVARITTKPLCASHSCSRAVKEHPRNLTNEQFCCIAKSSGVVGINFYPPFMGEDVSELVRHFDRFLALGGEDNIGLGSDFDGVDSLPCGIDGCQAMEKIIKSLPYSTKIREKIAYSNFLRLIKAYSC